jgi:putative membrane protein
MSGIGPTDRLTWFLEVAPVLIAIPLLVATRRSFPLTPLLYALIFVHGLILGGHYTYAKVPLGFWVQDAFDLARNHYDRLGHFAQGFIPAILAREILLRKTTLRPGKMLFYLVVSVALAFSAFYELIEWRAAAALDQDAEQFLATQGDVWDTQWDMFMAMTGDVVAQVALSACHDRQLRGLPEGGD